MEYNTDEHAEKLISATAWLMVKRGNVQAADVLQKSSAELDIWSNTDWGFTEYILDLRVPLSLFEQVMDHKEDLENTILSVANEIIGRNETLRSVIIKPKLELLSNWRENIYSLGASQFGMPKPNAQYEADIFMLMPFKDNTLDMVYRDHICELAKKLKSSIKRGDDFFTKHSIVEDIWSAINSAKIIIADCTGRNPNVFYELGISHTLGKNTIMITQNSEDVPFDLQQWRYIKYATSSQGLKELDKALEEAILNLLEPKNPKTNQMDDIPF